MAIPTLTSLPSLYESDETGWLENTASLVSQARFNEINANELSEYLLDMARRDKRAVFNRLVTLLAHLLKWEYQPERRSKSWRLTILEQRQRLELLVESGTLEKHAADVLAQTYQKAVQRTSIETGLSISAFPSECAFSLNHVLNKPLD